MDLVATVGTAPVWVPLCGAVSVAVWLDLGSPILFTQKRAGQGGRPFELFKFRTMRHATAESSTSENEHLRISRLGGLLRKSSLDELPTLLNLLKGDISLVGPRPLLLRYLSRYSPEQLRRHEVPPGITGWAQVNGRNAISWEEKFKLDVHYVDQCSLGLDLRILLQTFGKVLRQTDITPEQEATMSEFMGDSLTSEPVGIADGREQRKNRA